MLGTYDFCAHYEWTFAWMEEKAGHAFVRKYWDDGIGRDSQRHTRELIAAKGFEGMVEYWGHTLDEEAAGYTNSAGSDFFRIDMHECPSKGFLLKNDLEQYGDYCNHCIGWIGPVLKDNGYRLDHEHNHHGQCWFEIRKAEDTGPSSAPGEISGKKDVRLQENWRQKKHHRFGTTLDELKSLSDSTD